MELQEALLADGSPSPRPPSPTMTTLPIAPEGVGEGDSSSSGSGVGADAVSAQLINNITMLDYRSLGKTTTLIEDEQESGRTEGLRMGVAGGLPHLMSWNWPLIRRVLFWGVLSSLLACLAAVVAMVAALPRTCNPEMPWYQGGLFYEVFPASFQDSNGDGLGDLKGLTSRLDYIQGLGVQVVRLNSIFQAEYYPERYENVLSLMNMDKSLGTLADFGTLVSALHKRNISLVLDLPIYPFIERLEMVREISNSTEEQTNRTDQNSTRVHSPVRVSGDSIIATAIKYWINNGVDGFYLKGAEHFVNDINFAKSLNEWKKIIGSERILIVNHKALLKAQNEALNAILYRVDLVDVNLEVSNGTDHIKNQVNSVIGGVLWSKPGYPWVHWSVGSAETRRLSARLPTNVTLAAMLLNMMLPGSPSIFYGDEIALEEVSEPEKDFHESQHVHNLATMAWEPPRLFTSPAQLPWTTGGSGRPEQARCVRLLAAARAASPPLYLHAVWKDGVSLPNTQLRTRGDILVVERWYPRKNSYVFVANMGPTELTRDLSSWFYGGAVVVGTNEELQGKDVIFKAISLSPAEVIVIRLEK